jgi:hypothetical protein
VTKEITTDFGADGTDDISDECAFEQAVSFFSGLDSATIKILHIAAGNYYIGRQDATPHWYLEGHNVLSFSQVNNLTIIGDIGTTGIPTSTLRLNPCLRYGAFDPATGYRWISYGYGQTNSCCTSFILNSSNQNLLAFPGDMIYLNYCNRVHIQNIELDGNIENTVIGGGYTEGIEIAGYSGITLNASRNVTINNVRCHHFGYDGLTVRDSYCNPSTWVNFSTVILNLLIFSYNARNNMSWTGGPGVTVNRSEFSHAGQSRFISSPGAGINIEWETTPQGFPYPISMGTFKDCSFNYNFNYGMISDQAWMLNRDHTFNHCTFIGSNIAVLNSSRKVSFDTCFFVGTVNSHYGAPISYSTQVNNDQTKFLNCSFNEEYNVPEFVTTFDNGRRSFQQTADENTGCPVLFHSHLFLLNILGARTELTLCKTNTNYTMYDAFIFGGFPGYNHIKMEYTGFYNHGLNGCDCDHELSSLSYIDFIGPFNGQAVAQMTGINPVTGLLYSYLQARNAPAWCNTQALQYYGINNSTTTGNVGLFDQQFCSPCAPVWDIVPRYIHLPDPNPVTTLFSYSTTTPQYTTTSGMQSICIDPPERKRSSTKSIFNSDIHIYPNPVTKNLNIENLKPGTMIVVSNILGEEIIKNVAESSALQIDINSLRPGIYLIHTSEMQNGKFIKQ